LGKYHLSRFRDLIGCRGMLRAQEELEKRARKGEEMLWLSGHGASLGGAVLMVVSGDPWE
jgi:hypothetical protein